MKTMIISTLVLLNVLLSSSVCYDKEISNAKDKESYAENVHMYICIEALKLLKDRFLQNDFSQLENHIGTMSDIGTRQWQTEKITTGAYREDLEDVVNDIRGPLGLEASCSHFWNADDRSDGDHSLTHLSGIGVFPNAYTKITKYISGQWFRWSNGYHERLYINYLHTDGKVYRYSYHTRGLINFYKTKTIFLHSKINSLGQEEIIDQEVVLTDYVFHKIVWEVLGRMAHLKGDMSVPAHAHSDVHIRPLDGGDCYHNYIDDGAYTIYNWQTAKNDGGYINPYDTGNDPVRYLMYSTNQLADHYPSGPDCLEIPQKHSGDNNLPGGTYPILNNYYQQLGPPPQNITNTYQEGQHCFNFAIRATAGLFYWFAVETGMIAPDPGAFPVISSFTKNLPDNTIFRGETLRLICNASGSNLNYNWFYRICNISNWCTLPVNGLSFNQNNYAYSISNYYFSNRWTCSYYDSLCNAGVSYNRDFYENPLEVMVGVTVSNQFGQDTKFYDLNLTEKFVPFNGIRPPVPPVSGCPVLFTKDTNGYKCENNILHYSSIEEYKGTDIEDKIVLVNKPFLDTINNSFSFAIDETLNDIDYFDRISLLCVDHPKDFILAVTKYNDIVLIDPFGINSAEYAEKNETDITSLIQFDSAFDKKVEGFEKEIINLRYKTIGRVSSKDKLIKELLKANSPSDKIRNITDSTALILDPADSDNHKITNNKRPSGYISITDTSGNKITEDIDFARRVLRSIVTLPVLSGNNISRASLVFKDVFGLSYCASAELLYGGYNETKLDLFEAENSLTGNILKYLQKEDKAYAELDSSSFITLKFRNTKKEIPKDWVRDYVMVIKGRTEITDLQNAFSEDSIDDTVQLKENPDRFELKQNFPNPFNPVTNLEFGIPDLGFVSLKIYDALGKEVTTLVNETLSPGKYKVEFNGSKLSSGVYYYKLKAGRFEVIRKMLLIK